MGLSERRACSIVSADRKMVRYRSCRPPDTELRTQLRDLANERKRFGYRRLFVLLRQEGEPSGINRIYRLYREEGLTVRRRRARRRAVGSRAPILVESKPNARWSVDFVHDQLACGRRLRILNIVDDVTRECLAAIPETSISGRRVARELTALIKRRGKPGMIVSDNGTEFTSNAMFAWALDNRVVWHFIGPDDEAEIEYGVHQPADTLDLSLRELCRELGEREAARKLEISRTALRRAMKLGAEAMSRAIRGRLATKLMEGETR